MVVGVFRGIGGVGGFVDAHAVEEERHDLGRRERLVEDQARVGAGDGQPAQQVRGFERVPADLAAVGFEERGQPAEVGRPVALRHRLQAVRELHHLDRGPQLPDVGEAAAEDVDGGDQARLERQRRVDGGDRVVDRLRVERGIDHRRDQALLVREDPEDRAFGDARRFRDLPGRDRGAVRQQQRERRRDDLGAPFGGGQGRRPLGRHRSRIYE